MGIGKVDKVIQYIETTLHSRMLWCSLIRRAERNANYRNHAIYAREAGGFMRADPFGKRRDPLGNTGVTVG
jgi:hypothetical protein